MSPLALDCLCTKSETGTTSKKIMTTLTQTFYNSHKKTWNISQSCNLHNLGSWRRVSQHMVWDMRVQLLVSGDRDILQYIKDHEERGYKYN